MAEYPKEMTPALREVLGMICFQLAPMAHVFRAAGYEIETSAEAEQAFMLHWLIPFAIEHGSNWHKAAAEEMQKVLDAAKERQRIDPPPTRATVDGCLEV